MVPATSVIAITLNWNGAADTVGCVQALLRSSQPPRQIVVCDNASRPASWQELLGLRLGGREEAGAEARHGKDRLRYQHIFTIWIQLIDFGMRTRCRRRAGSIRMPWTC